MGSARGVRNMPGEIPRMTGSALLTPVLISRCMPLGTDWFTDRLGLNRESVVSVPLTAGRMIRGQSAYRMSARVKN